MPTVKVLPEDVANRIAAGEVVERPASVVKELVENSIDAGAGRIEVNIEEGGKKLIEVVDDGCGMTDQDVVVAVQRFATSKISTADDLQAVVTMGFRGEALPSIAAVSRMRIITRPADGDEGYVLVVNGGQIEDLRAIGCPAGTTVQVAELFFNTPARRKFLGTTATERGHCQEWVSRLALARPDIAFKFTHNGTVLFTSTGSGDLLSVLAAIYGSTGARQFIPISLQARGLAISGFISSPRLFRSTKQHQLFFVNRRFVRSRMLSHALTEAYGMLLPAAKNPLCAIHIDIDPHSVDPNVHPTKIEVRFRNQAEVHNLLSRAAAEALAAAGYRSLGQRPSAEAEHPRDRLPAGRLAPADEEQRSRIRRLRLGPSRDLLDDRQAGLEVYQSAPLAQEAHNQQRLWQAAAEGDVPVRVLGQHADRYIVAQLGQQLLLIDQHRAAERVAYEALENADDQVRSQLLVVPLTLELSATELAAAENHQQALAKLGFVIEPFGGTSLLVRAVPAVIADRDVEQILRGLIEEMAQHGATQRLDDSQLRASIACHGALKAGEKLSQDEMERLVADLLRTQAPAVCPHGDPVILTLGIDYLDRRFERR